MRGVSRLLFFYNETNGSSELMAAGKVHKSAESGPSVIRKIKVIYVWRERGRRGERGREGEGGENGGRRR